MAIYKCKINDRFPAMVERQNWKNYDKTDKKLGGSYGSKYQK